MVFSIIKLNLVLRVFKENLSAYPLSYEEISKITNISKEESLIIIEKLYEDGYLSWSKSNTRDYLGNKIYNNEEKKYFRIKYDGVQYLRIGGYFINKKLIKLLFISNLLKLIFTLAFF